MTFSSFSFKVPGEVIYGENSISKLPEILSTMSLTNVLVISDRGLEAAGMVKKITDVLDAASTKYSIFLDVEANPSCDTVDKATAMYKMEGLNGIVCLGGGSPMDTAKAIAVLASNGGKIQDYEGANKFKSTSVQILAIPTTAGTGSEVTPFAVITDKEKNYKLTVFSYEIVPEVALLDPSMISTLPALVAAATGMDALTHAVESYLSRASSLFSDAMAEKAMELIGMNIRRFVANRGDVEAASGMLLGSMFAGIAFSWARLGDCHAMAHPLGGFFGVPHGIANAILLPTILEFNALADNGKYEKIYNYIKRADNGSSFVPEMLVNEIKELLEQLSIPKTLSEVGVKQELIHDMAIDAMKSGNVLINPRQTLLADIEALYQKAL
ncbi:alcohol dehydrogenase, class IV [Desulfosporosinus orientis DSM 765]|uniref:Alcohol dehydrogenase, class IV n=1 Tax=Desulfosporosinus orientis (strain ATCC 19365 / DSM 765 / NCIMB 8382 / VKM B-1628 / Singapore I) TaxID=768706 RepID=G7WCS9_DESOD|nr:iron-containing alcohol dehydrogenase [Desulfosporosinus orientis]AET66835.1 alcohol dehydrogenase, class IV [Desulfosporosinus orientis DSM 765]